MTSHVHLKTSCSKLPLGSLRRYKEATTLFCGIFSFNLKLNGNLKMLLSEPRAKAILINHRGKRMVKDGEKGLQTTILIHLG